MTSDTDTSESNANYESVRLHGSSGSLPQATSGETRKSRTIPIPVVNTPLTVRLIPRPQNTKANASTSS